MFYELLVFLCEITGFFHYFFYTMFAQNGENRVCGVLGFKIFRGIMLLDPHIMQELQCVQMHRSEHLLDPPLKTAEELFKCNLNTNVVNDLTLDDCLRYEQVKPSAAKLEFLNIPNISGATVMS